MTESGNNVCCSRQAFDSEPSKQEKDGETKKHPAAFLRKTLHKQGLAGNNWRGLRRTRDGEKVFVAYASRGTKHLSNKAHYKHSIHRDVTNHWVHKLISSSGPAPCMLRCFGIQPLQVQRSAARNKNTQELYFLIDNYRCRFYVRMENIGCYELYILFATGQFLSPLKTGQDLSGQFCNGGGGHNIELVYQP